MLETILVVEDDKNLRLNLKEIFEEENYHCVVAENGWEALANIHLISPDLIISDINMPEMDGFKFYTELKNTSPTQLIPFIFLSANDDYNSRRSAMNMGVDDFILKPFSVDDLLSSVKTRLDKKRLHDYRIESIKTNIIKNVPHEMRTPLVSILGFTDLILEDEETFSKEEVKDLLKCIKSSGLRLKERIEKFVRLAEVKTITNFMCTQKEELKPHCYITKSFVIRVIDQKLQYFDRYSDFICSVEEAKICISEDHLTTILFELLDNSIKFSSPGTKIKLNAFISQDVYRIEIHDNGRGFSEKEIQEIAVFNQFEKDKYQQIGLGLGLPITKNIIELVGGAFTINSEKNSFTSIELKIPIQN